MVCWMALASVACRAEARDADGATRAMPDAGDDRRRDVATPKAPAAETNRANGARDDEAADAGRDAATSALPALAGFFEALPVADHPDGYPDYVDTSTPVLAGFSLGASEILPLAVQAPGRFPRIALIEGATGAWTDARIDAYVAGGGLRVLYGAGQRANEAAAKASAKRLVARRLDARVVYAPVNHTFEPPLEDAVRGELAWWLAGDARWNL